MSDFSIRAAQRADSAVILELIRELADYERLLHEVTTRTSDIEQHLFGTSPKAECLLAARGETVVGFALFFHNFSTFLGKPGLYLEDLFVKPAYRGHGIGKGLLKELAKLAVARKCGRVEWQVLDWNETAIGFYKSIGAKPQDEWTTYRLTGEALTEFATQH